MKKVLLLYYSQAGQTHRAMDSFAKGLAESVQYDVLRIEPSENFTFPWKMSEFFRAFPRCVGGLAPTVIASPAMLETDWQQYDLVILGYQVWFLSPSLPVQGFLQSKYAPGLNAKKVITLVTCRNLWQSALTKMQNSLQSLGAIHLGQITICELSPVWASFVTTPRWLLTGKKAGFLIFPPAGIDDNEFLKLEATGRRIGSSWVQSSGQSVSTLDLKSNLERVSLALMDKIGNTFFAIWAQIILTLAPAKGLLQDFLLLLFRFNLIVLILGVGPCTKIFEYLVKNDLKWAMRFHRG